MIFPGPQRKQLLGTRASHEAPSSEKQHLLRSVAPPGFLAPSVGLLLWRRAHLHASRDRQTERASALLVALVCDVGEQSLRSTGDSRSRFRLARAPPPFSNDCGQIGKSRGSGAGVRTYGSPLVLMRTPCSEYASNSRSSASNTTRGTAFVSISASMMRPGKCVGMITSQAV